MSPAEISAGADGWTLIETLHEISEIEAFKELSEIDLSDEKVM